MVKVVPAVQAELVEPAEQLVPVVRLELAAIARAKVAQVELVVMAEQVWATLV